MCFAEGCFGFERRLPDPSQRVVVTTRSHDTEAVRKCIAACEPTEVIRVGGAGHKVMARQVSIYWRRRLSVDVCVCPYDTKRDAKWYKTAETTVTKLAIGIVHH